MSSTWENQAQKLSEMIDSNEQEMAHLFLEQLMLLPVDIQDKIIQEVSSLQRCNKEQVAGILREYSMIDIK